MLSGVAQIGHTIAEEVGIAYERHGVFGTEEINNFLLHKLTFEITLHILQTIS